MAKIDSGFAVLTLFNIEDSFNYVKPLASQFLIFFFKSQAMKKIDL